MVRNKEKYAQVVSLRKRGFTLEEIARYCAISKSTASVWLKNNAFSAQVTKQNAKRAGADNARRLRLVNKARSGERTVRYKEAALSAETEYRHYKKDPLFIAGLTLYIGAGDRKNERVVRLSTADMVAHRIFLRFTQEYLGVRAEQVHLWLLLYADHSEELCMKKWRQSTGVPYTQFYKNQVIKNKPQKQTLHYGVGNTIIGSTVLKHKLSRWIELMTKELAQ